MTPTVEQGPLARGTYQYVCVDRQGAQTPAVTIVIKEPNQSVRFRIPAADCIELRDFRDGKLYDVIKVPQP